MKKLFWLIFAFFFICSFAHEFTHAIVALCLGFEVKGFHFGFPVSYVNIEWGSGKAENLWLVYWSGGIINALGLVLVWFKGRKYFSVNEQTWILMLMVLQFAYSLWEAFVYPSL